MSCLRSSSSRQDSICFTDSRWKVFRQMSRPWSVSTMETAFLRSGSELAAASHRSPFSKESRDGVRFPDKPAGDIGRTGPAAHGMYHEHHTRLDRRDAVLLEFKFTRFVDGVSCLFEQEPQRLVAVITWICLLGSHVRSPTTSLYVERPEAVFALEPAISRMRLSRDCSRPPPGRKARGCRMRTFSASPESLGSPEEFPQASDVLRTAPQRAGGIDLDVPEALQSLLTGRLEDAGSPFTT